MCVIKFFSPKCQVQYAAEKKWLEQFHNEGVKGVPSMLRYSDSHRALLMSPWARPALELDFASPRFMGHVVDVLESIHKLNIVHCDVRPPNFLVAENGLPLLIDFGSAVEKESDTHLTRRP